MQEKNQVLELLTSQVPLCKSSHKVKDVREKLLADMPNFKSVNYIYVIDRKSVV